MARRTRRRFVRLINLLTDMDRDCAVMLITGHQVLVAGRIIDNPNALVPNNAPIVIKPSLPLRGTVKLRAALIASGVVPAGKTCLDVGAAAGGFTTALLDAGALLVYAVDTGYGQLRGTLRQNPRVVNLERTNLADLNAHLVPDCIELVTVDLSYLPLADALGQLGHVTFSPNVELLALIKPTFELRQGRRVCDPGEIDKAVGDGGSRG
jgi:23S rRNA (cytidine1920-2'-O)/16S rRNA (cytidine1409-2'-O)-methyltransferase